MMYVIYGRHDIGNWLINNRQDILCTLIVYCNAHPSLAVLGYGGLDVGPGPHPLHRRGGLALEGALQPEWAVPEHPDVAGEILGELGHLGGLAEVHPPLGHHL